jgi:hypothetical protein
VSGLTDALDAICRLVVSAPDADAVARELGEVVEEQVDAVEVRPRDERFTGAFVVRLDDGAVSHVDLSLREPSSLEELGTVFGEGREARRRPPAPRTFHFPAEGRTLIASVAGDAVSAVTVRRDPADG